MRRGKPASSTDTSTATPTPASRRLFLFCALVLTVATVTAAVPARAEYRVFSLVIENPQTKEFRTVTSTLDPLQYPSYYPLKPDEKISYTETWRCFGRTGDFTPYCPNPKAQPASENSP